MILTKIKLHLLTLEVGLSLARNADEVHFVAMFTCSAETAYNEWKWRDKASIRQICFKQCLGGRAIIYNWVLYHMVTVKVWFLAASLTL